MLSLSASVAAPLFRITDLGKLPGSYATTASDMNDDATITGDPDDPFVWSPQAGLAEPPRMPEGTGFAPTGINNAGDMVGKEWDGLSGRAFMRRADGRWTTNHWCGHVSVATAINNAGQVVGYGNTFDKPFRQPVQAFIWTEEGGLQPLVPRHALQVRYSPFK